MKISLRKATLGTALATLTLAGSAVATAPASAAPAAGAYNGKCGSGYYVVDWMPVASSSATLGTVYVTYNYDTGVHCAVLVRSNPGTRMFMEVTLGTWPTSDKPAKDYGSYKDYAGPVYLDASKSDAQCLEWSGTIDIYYNSVRGQCS